MTAEITISDGTTVLVDAEDYEHLMQWKWSAHRQGYAMRNAWLVGGKRKGIMLHREILQAADGQRVDHINGDVKDNRRSNLRIVNSSENNCNRRVRSDSKSGYKGVTFNKESKKWRARICKGSVSIFLGYFENKHNAARAYNKAALEIHGDYAKLNDIKEDI